MCKFLIYLCKYMQVGDLSEIEKTLSGLFKQTDAYDAYANTSEFKQIKYYFSNYIFEIHSNAESYKIESKFCQCFRVSTCPILRHE
jgi:hypothetical protein